MSDIGLAFLGLGAGFVVVAAVIFLSTAMTTISRVFKRMRAAGKDLCVVCGAHIPCNAVYCDEHKHLAAVGARRRAAG
jgi:hypothetical protein